MSEDNETFVKLAYHKARERFDPESKVYMFTIYARFFKDIVTLKKIFKVAQDLGIDLDS